MNPLGYLLGDLVGIGAGVVVAQYLKTTAMTPMLAALVTILAAGAVATIPSMYVWVRGLVWWNISDTSEGVAKLQQATEQE